MMGLVSLQEETQELPLCAMWGHSKNMSCQPGGVLLPGKESVGTLILNLQPPEWWKINVCCLGHPVCGDKSWWTQDLIPGKEGRKMSSCGSVHTWSKLPAGERRIETPRIHNSTADWHLRLFELKHCNSLKMSCMPVSVHQKPPTCAIRLNGVGERFSRNQLC